MNRITSLLLGFSISSMTLANAAENEAPVYQWAVDLSSETAGDQANGLFVDETGVYYLGSEGSQCYGNIVSDPANPFRTLYYDDKEIGTGSLSDSNSANHNCVIFKTGNDGNMVWRIYSSCGDQADNQGGIVKMKDGSLVAVVKMRAASGYLADAIKFVDGEDKNHLIDWGNADEPVRAYRVLVLNINAETGAINSVNQISTDITPAANATGTYKNGAPDGVNVNSVVTDGEFVYFGGYYLKAMTFNKVCGTTAVMTPHSMETWDGNTQDGHPGNLYIVKLDSKGNYVGSFTSESPIHLGNVLGLYCGDGMIYAAGMIKGKDSGGVYGDVDFGGVTLKTYQSQSPFVACLDTDLKVRWAKLFEGTYAATKGKSFVLQFPGMVVDKGNLWLSGMFNGKVINPDNNEVMLTSVKDQIPREGFLMSLDAGTGKFKAAAASNDSYGITVPDTKINCITGYFAPFVDQSDDTHVYVFGYGMNAKVGVFVRRYDVGTLKSDPAVDQWNLTTDGGAPTCQFMNYDAETAMFTYTMRGNRAFTLFGTDAKVTPKNNQYGVAMARFKMPFKTVNGISSVEDDNNGYVRVYGGYGTVVVESDDFAEVEIFDLSGRCVATVSVENGRQSVSLKAGFYITRYGKIIVK